MIADDQLAQKVIKPRQRQSHKGSYGRLLLIGGAYPYGGAIIMAALASVNSGAGLVMVATEKENISALHVRLPEAMAFDMQEENRLIEQVHQADVVLIGPGLGDTVQAKETFELVLGNIKPNQTLVVDGSALTLAAQNSNLNWPTDKLVLTPHQKEWERLSGLAIEEQTDPANQTALASFPNQTILVAKSHATKIYDQEGHLASLEVGGPYQATGGMGDTLAGMIAGFLVQFRENPFETVVAATYLHSAIAQDLSKDHYVVLPTSISQAISTWMKRLSEQI